MSFAEQFRFAVSQFLADASELAGVELTMDSELMRKQGKGDVSKVVTFRDLADAFIETVEEGTLVENDKDLSFTNSVSRRCYDVPTSATKDGTGAGFYVVQFREIARSLGIDEAQTARGAKQTTPNKLAKALTAAQFIELRRKAAEKAKARQATTEG